MGDQWWLMASTQGLASSQLALARRNEVQQFLVSWPSCISSSSPAFLPGVSPENTGILGDWASYDLLRLMPFKTINEMTTAVAATNGVTGSPEWIQFLGNSAPALYKDGTVRFNETEDIGSWATDQMRGNVTLDAMAANYTFFWSELGNIAYQVCFPKQQIIRFDQNDSDSIWVSVCSWGYSAVLAVAGYEFFALGDQRKREGTMYPVVTK